MPTRCDNVRIAVRYRQASLSFPVLTVSNHSVKKKRKYYQTDTVHLDFTTLLPRSLTSCMVSFSDLVFGNVNRGYFELHLCLLVAEGSRRDDSWSREESELNESSKNGRKSYTVSCFSNCFCSVKAIIQSG